MKSTREAAYETACKALENAGVEEAEFLSRKVVDYLGQENLLAQKTEAVSVYEDVWNRSANSCSSRWEAS